MTSRKSARTMLHRWNTAQAKPLRRRRRWLIVAFVLVLVSMVSWWYWPRGDARFVGKWSVSSSSTTLWFHGNGVGHIHNGSTIDYYFFWRAEGKKLFIKPTIPTWLGRIAPQQLCGAPGGCQEWQISTVYVVKPHPVLKFQNDSDRLYLEGGYLGVFEHLSLARIPE